MKSVRFSKVVDKCGKPEVYLLMSETDPDFHKAVTAGKIMSLSDESHGSGTEYGTVGYDKKRRGQLLIFPKSLKSFSNARIIGIKYDLFAEEERTDDKKSAAKRGRKETAKSTPSKKAKKDKPSKKDHPKATPKKLIPFPSTKREHEDGEDDDDDLKATVRQAMRALEKGNSVAAYNLLKRVSPD